MTDAAALVAPGTPGGRGMRRLPLVHLAIGLVLALVTMLVLHDVGFMLSHSFWIDESWVAVSGRLPLSDLPSVTSSTPIGWNFLQRLFDPLGDEAPRLLPLAFSGAATAAGYALGAVAWPGRPAVRIASGIAVAAAVALGPQMLLRNDLKQYTADVFFTLLIWLLAIVWETTGRRSTLIALTAVSAFGLLFSLTVAFVATSAFAALVIVALVRRRWRRLIEAVVGAAIALAGILLWYLVFYRSAEGPLDTYWRDFYPSLRDLGPYLVDHIRVIGRLTPNRGLAIGLLIPVVIAVHLALAIAARRAVSGVFAVVLPLGMIAAGVLRIYPLLDTRTSLFLIVGVAALTMLTAVRLVELVWQRVPRRGAALAGSVATIALLIVPIVFWGAPDLRSTRAKPEDPKGLIAYLNAHRAPGDLVAVDAHASYAYGYYQRGLHLDWAPSTATNGFTIVFPDDPDVISINLSPSKLRAAYNRALAEDPGGTLWVLTTHIPLHPVAILEDKVAMTAITLGHDKLYRIPLVGTPISP